MEKTPRRGRIVGKKSNGNTYYSYICTYRVKVDPESAGKTKGSGKSKVVTESHYLGTAETILEKIQGANARNAE